VTEGPLDHPSDGSADPLADRPPQLTVAASLAVVQAMVMIILAILEFASVSSQRLGFGLSTAVFFAAYGVVLAGAALALWRRHGWARGPVLITQLIVLGLAWNLREHLLAALGLAAFALVVVAAVVHPDTVAALEDHPGADE
jgi:hypothetical protein